MTTYGDDIDLSRAAGHGAFSVLAGFAASLDGMSGEDISPSTITAAIKAMDEQELPDGAGLVFRCDGEQVPGQPAVCVRGALTTTLDAQGRPTTYTPTR
jgi:branched-chain amino acid transport system substrate-binding protein